MESILFGIRLRRWFRPAPDHGITPGMVFFSFCGDFQEMSRPGGCVRKSVYSCLNRDGQDGRMFRMGKLCGDERIGLRFPYLVAHPLSLVAL
ncbi:MAG: hypothetical protein C4527_01565 [Candidatus Omnitrophota bacterium]|nr:MAG: hypothetical protein C4527_01565 [Candidatus Omnitrophota bacterium]